MLSIEQQQQLQQLQPAFYSDCENLSLGWGDFPVALQVEAHPSSFVCSCDDSKQHNMTSPLRCDVRCEVGIVSEDEEEEDVPIFIVSPPPLMNKRKERPQDFEEIDDDDETIVTFGWSDFPLLLHEESRDFPEYHHLEAPVRSVIPALESQQQQQKQQLQIHCETNTVISFGWNDFPLIGMDTTSFPDVHVIVDDSPSSSSSSSSSVSNGNVSAHDHRRRRSHTTTRVVQFSSVHIREYAVQLGDHPMCSAYPVALDWTYQTGGNMTVDEYEEARCSSNDGGCCCWDGRLPRRMNVMERRSRLAVVMGIDNAAVDAMERQRREQEIAAAASAADSCHCDDVVPLQLKEPLTRVPTVHTRAFQHLLKSASADYSQDDNDNTKVEIDDAPEIAVSKNNKYFGFVEPTAKEEEEHDVGTVVPRREERDDDDDHHLHQRHHFQENLLEMSMHISSHVVHPGFEIQIQ